MIRGKFWQIVEEVACGDVYRLQDGLTRNATAVARDDILDALSSSQAIQGSSYFNTGIFERWASAANADDPHDILL